MRKVKKVIAVLLTMTLGLGMQADVFQHRKRIRVIR